MPAELKFNEISPERIKLFGKLKDNGPFDEDCHEMTKEKIDHIIKVVLKDVYDQNMARYRDLGDNDQN
jgi:hypothetical protein